MNRIRMMTAGALLAGALATPALAQVVNDRDTLAIAAVADNGGFDRAMLTTGHKFTYWQAVYDTLLFLGADGKLYPNMAVEWSYNDDSTILTLKLREGISFTDGMPFDAEAVKANIEALKNGGGAHSSMVKSVIDYEIVSPLEIKLHLDGPDPSFLRYLANVGGVMASPAMLGAEDAAENPVGSGPYIYDKANSVSGRQYVYTRNPDHWNVEAYDFERLLLIPMNELVARINALKSGQVDAAVGTASAIADAEANGLVTHEKDVTWIGLTLADRGGELLEPMGDVRVRQAINMAIDSESILKYVELDHGRLSDQIFPIESSSYIAELDDYYPYDPDRARALLAEAGYADGFTLTMPNTFQDFAPIVEQQLGEVGIKVDWVPIAAGTGGAEVRSGKYPAFLMNFGHEGDWGTLGLFAFPTSQFNPLKYDDPALVAMLDETRVASGDDQVEKFKEINRYLVEQAWFNPWYRRNTIFFTTPEVDVVMDGIVPNLVNFKLVD